MNNHKKTEAKSQYEKKITQTVQQIDKYDYLAKILRVAQTYLDLQKGVYDA